MMMTMQINQLCQIIVLQRPNVFQNVIAGPSGGASETGTTGEEEVSDESAILRGTSLIAQYYEDPAGEYLRH